MQIQIKKRKNNKCYITDGTDNIIIDKLLVLSKGCLVCTISKLEIFNDIIINIPYILYFKEIYQKNSYIYIASENKQTILYVDVHYCQLPYIRKEK